MKQFASGYTLKGLVTLFMLALIQTALWAQEEGSEPVLQALRVLGHQRPRPLSLSVLLLNLQDGNANPWFG